MASYLDKFKVKVGIDDNTKLDLSCQHITTADWMQLSPVYVKEMVPGERLKVSQETFTRLAPMPVPTFGRGNVHNRGFFVPFRTIFKGWNDFITDTKHVASDSSFTSGSLIASSVPSFKMGDLVGALMRSSDNAQGNEFGDFTTITVADIPNYQTLEDLVTDDNQKQDFWVSGYLPVGVNAVNYSTAAQATTNALGIVFNEKGRQAMKVLNSLGYQVSGAVAMKDVTMSALPLLAYLKIYLDWYYPAQYYDDVTRTMLESILNYDPTNQTNQLNNQQIETILLLVTFVNYDSDYFVSAFDQPDGPVVGAASSVWMNDITNNVNSNTASYKRTVWSYGADNPYGASPIQSMPNTPLLGTSDGSESIGGAKGVGTISQYALNALRKLTDYMKRHQLVGARAMDRYLARFGKSLSAEKLNRSLYLNHMSFGLQIGDIMSQSDTYSQGGAELGSYAGKGLGFGTANYEFDTDEYGIFMVCTSIIPTVGYYQGIDRSVLHMNKLDFWTPEFDQLGNQAISKAELYLNTTNPVADINNNVSAWNGIFGYTPRYAEYKIGRDRLTGDFRIPTKNVVGDTSDSWHLFRKFTGDSFDQDNTNIKHSKEFVQGTDSEQYNRIF